MRIAGVVTRLCAATATATRPSSGWVVNAPKVLRRGGVIQIQNRWYSTTDSRGEDEIASTQDCDTAASSTKENDSDSPPTPSSSPPSSSIPWYLQHQSEAFPPSSATLPLPPKASSLVPTDAPPCISQIVDAVIDTHGLIDPTILDLRHITAPSPALGPGLIMVIATAHSERHLHIAADKLCRWLRTELKLSPRADGLLGQNELKVRRKRYARKMRALAMTSLGGDDGMGTSSSRRNRSVGGHDGLPDDGFSTGWICVSMPVRTDGRETEVGSSVGEAGNSAGDAGSPVGEAEEMSGFWDDGADGVTTLALQLVTPPTRERLDLETLWRKRSDAARKAMADGSEEVVAEAGTSAA